MGVVGRAQKKQWSSPKICLVLGVPELPGFKVSQRMAVSIQRLRSAKAGVEHRRQGLRRLRGHPSDRETHL